MAKVPTQRLDIRCVELGLAPSRQRAQALILAGNVLVADVPVTKAGTPVRVDAAIRVRGSSCPYVSRGGVKLAGALKAFNVDVSNQTGVDIGASTGGFTDCLLQHGARHVIAVDVGYGQLAQKLRNDPRVSCLERINARHLDAPALQQKVAADIWPPTFATIDVSFISLRLILPAVLRILGSEATVIALVKPQFETEKHNIGKKGVVTDESVRLATIESVKTWAQDHGFICHGGIDASITGPRGNKEHLMWLTTSSAHR